MDWLEQNISDYYKWLKDNTICRYNEDSGWNTISTPFIGLFNDNIEIYIKKDSNNNIILSDDGDTISNLELCGVNLKGKRKECIEYILSNYGIQSDDKELSVIASPNNFPQKKHNLVCAIMEISELSVLSTNTVISIFRQDVRAFLDKKEISYTPNFIAQGSSGIDFNFDFQITGKRQELLIKTFDSLTKSNVPGFLFGLEDVKNTREKQIEKKIDSVIFYNDKKGGAVKNEIYSALQSRNVSVIPWSKKEQQSNIQKLSAA